MAKIILISGLVGAGKSTYARKLEKLENAIRFSIDEWMTTLFKADWPEDLNFNWSIERIYRIEDQIWALVEKLIAIDVSVILDLGLLQKEHRQKFYDRAAQKNINIETHLIEADEKIRWQRVQTRNEDKGETFSLEVTREMFDFCENLYEQPEGSEVVMCKFIRTDS